MFENLRLKQFCCGCTLKTGCYIIGTLGWINSILQAKAISSYRDNGKDSNSGIVFDICIAIFSCCISVILVVGVYNGNHKLMLPWLCLNFLSLISIYVLTFLCFIAIFSVASASLMITLFFLLLLTSALITYFYLCVWSHYQDLNELTTPQFMTPHERQMTEGNPYQGDVAWQPPQNNI